jgi:very-short-patch-repair endonuclease
MTAVLRQLDRQFVEEQGWRSGTDLEDAATRWFHRVGLSPREVEQQYRVGRFRLDFAIPSLQIAVEVDGWHHRSPEGAARDAERDSWLRSEGWLVLRVDDRHGRESFDEQMVRVLRAVLQAKEAAT